MKKKEEHKKMEIQNNNPFDDLSFWVQLATIDFIFLEKEKRAENVSDKKSGGI
jgi:hypothetical protein